MLHVHRPAPSVHLVFGAIWGSLILIGGLVALRSREPGFPVLWIGIAGWLLSSTFVASTKLAWSEDQIWYSSLGRTRTLRFRDVAFAALGADRRSGPTYALCLNGKAAGSKALCINLKLFAQPSIQQLRQTLSQHQIEWRQGRSTG